MPVRATPAVRDRAHAGQIWLAGTLASAAAMTAIDAALLQQKKSFFTGGFLTSVSASSRADAAGFLLSSAAVDAGATGAAALLLLWLTAALPLTRPARLSLIVAGAMAPLLVWSFLTYRLLAYLGDAFDLDLMFELAGGSPGELFAVASAHLVAPTALVAAGSVVLAGLVWTINRCGDADQRVKVTMSGGLVAAGIGAFLSGVLATATLSAASDLVEDGLRRKASGNIFLRLASAATDVDRDGFGIGGRISDPAPFDAAIYPYALDVPGNGVDEDAVGGDLPADAPPYVEPRPSAPWVRRPHVVLVVLESFRADAVGAVRNGTPVTPTLDVLARQGVSSAQAFSHNGYTTQSRFHLLTGGLAGLHGGDALIDDFRAHGYQTAYFSAQDESFGGPEFGVGFERAEVAYDARADRALRYSSFSTPGSLAVPHGVLRERIEAFLARRDPARPVFLYVNFHDTHYPYTHQEIEPITSDRVLRESEIAPARQDAVRDMYYNTAANVDRAVGATLAAVARAVGAEPAVIVTADHGESLFEEQFLGHGYALNDVQTRIPLIVRGLPMEIAEPFGQADLRGAIAAALARDPAGPDTPRTFEQPGKAVFQYLGTLQRPRQVAFVSGVGRIAFDFRDGRVSLPDGRTPRPADLDAAHAERFIALVRFWERMRLAREAGGVS